MKIYLCGPINGCTDAECTDWREEAKKSFPDAIDPMRRDYRGVEETAYRNIVELDKIDVANCDGLLVNFPAPSVGTSMEMLFAWQIGKPIALWHRPDASLSPWLIYHSHFRSESLTECVGWLRGVRQ